MIDKEQDFPVECDALMRATAQVVATFGHDYALTALADLYDMIVKEAVETGVPLSDEVLMTQAFVENESEAEERAADVPVQIQ